MIKKLRLCKYRVHTNVRTKCNFWETVHNIQSLVIATGVGRVTHDAAKAKEWHAKALAQGYSLYSFSSTTVCRYDCCSCVTSVHVTCPYYTLLRVYMYHMYTYSTADNFFFLFFLF